MAKARTITGIDAQATTETNAKRIARTRLEEFQEWGRYADEPQDVSELHNLRIAAKRLRYTLEIFADVLPTASGPLLDEVTKVQEELGEVHDTDVMIALVHHCLDPVAFQQDSSTRHNQKPNNKAARLTKENDVAEQAADEEAAVSQILLASLLDACGTLTNGERRGLEELMNTLQRRRDEYYGEFHRHWHQLQERDFSKALSQQLEM